jgi:hypothetical protein
LYIFLRLWSLVLVPFRQCGSDCFSFLFFLCCFMTLSMLEDTNGVLQWYSINCVSGSLKSFWLRFGHIRLNLCLPKWSNYRIIKLHFEKIGVLTNRGGILYVKDNINVSRRCDLHFDDLEGIWVQIKINGKHILHDIIVRPLASLRIVLFVQTLVFCSVFCGPFFALLSFGVVCYSKTNDCFCNVQ